MYELEYGTCSEVYATYEEARQAQRELNAQGMTGSSIDRI
jgi:hypothetical protein